MKKKKEKNTHLELGGVDRLVPANRSFVVLPEPLLLLALHLRLEDLLGFNPNTPIRVYPDKDVRVQP